MLRLMRENAGSWLIKVLLGIIVVVFIFLGIGPDGVKQENIAATVNKKVISMDEYRVAYNNLVDMYRNKFGDNMNDELIKILGIKNQTLETLIGNTLILQEAAKLGIDISKDEVIHEITNIKSFQNNGTFSKSIYNNYLKYTRQPAEYFEAKRKEALLVGKVKSLVTDSVQIADVEAEEWFMWEKTVTNLDYILFKPKSYNDLTPAKEDIEKYYEKNKAEYKSEPKVKAIYLSFSPETYKANAIISEQEITVYYEANIDKYGTEKTVNARHILIKVDGKADEALVENARVKALDVYTKATTEVQSFEDLAKQYSEGPSGSNGGDLGTFTHDRMVKAFADKAFAMSEGEVSEPVRTDFGWHIIKVEKINKPSQQKLTEVKDDIKDALLKEKSENLAYDDSASVFDEIIGGAELKEIADTRSLKFIETKLFTQQTGPYELPETIRQEFAKTAFNMAANEISDVIEFAGNYYIIQVREKKAAEIQPLDMIEREITNATEKEMRSEKAKADATKLLAELKENTKEITELEDVKTTGLFTRDNNGNELNIDSNVIAAAFKLSQAKTLPDEPVSGAKGYYIISLKERNKPEAAKFESEKDKIKDRLLSTKQTNVFDNWLAQVKEKSSIEKNQRLVN